MATVYQSVLAGGAVPVLQQKTVTAGTSNVTVNPDTGYDGMSQVTVEPTPTEAGYVTAGTSRVVATPTSGKFFDGVYVDPTPTIQGIAAPSTSQEVYTPTSGMHFSKFTVDPIPSEYIIPSGNKSLSYTSNGSRTGIDVRAYSTASVNVNVQPTEETLWTNSSSTSSFAEQTITLNSGKKFSGHTYIKITWRYGTADSTSSSILIPLASLQTSGTGSGTNELAFGIRGSNGNFMRMLRWTSDTQLFISKAAQTSGTSASNNNAIPTSIVGVTI